MKIDKLMCRLAEGDKSAFKEIYDDTRKPVYYTCLSILREQSLVEDVMQNTYLKVIEKANTYQSGTNARAWILRIAKNEALNLKKRRSFEINIDETENDGALGSYRIDEHGGLIDMARRSLSEEEFNILMLVSVSGYKRREIAEMLEMPIATVTWKYNETVKKLRKLLENK